MKNPNVVNIEKATDISLAKLRANYGNPAKGFCEEEADKMREKILNTPNTEELYEIKGTKYYFSTDGDDQNDGLSPQSPKASQDALDALPLKEGDAVLFKRGDTFRFSRTHHVSVDNIIFGSYGEGIKPAIFGSPEQYADNDSWKEVSPNIWELDFPYDYVGGVVLDYGMLIGAQKYNRIDFLTQNGDYTNDMENKKFYLYCNLGKPNEVYHSIELMNSLSIFRILNRKDITFDNLCIKYSSGFGVSAPNTKGSLTVTNCEFGFLGGKWYGPAKGKLRYGNAVEFWCGANDSVISNNWFYQTYDSALTWQGNVATNTYTNLYFNDNLFEYNNCDIEFFCTSGNLIKNFHIENNIMRFTSMGWGSRTFDGGIRGIEGCIRASTDSRKKPDGIKLESAYFINNTLDSPARQIINWNIIPDQREKIHTKGTKLFVRGSYRTLTPCLQGLQTDISKQPHDYRFANNYEELVEMFPLFEEGAKIYWEE